MSNTIHVWEKHEIVLDATGRYTNPYTQVECWVELRGPGFAKRVYGYWDGGQRFCVRLLATAPGLWRWESGSNQEDAGLNGQWGEFEAVPWGETACIENPNRRGFLRATPDGHALEYADGTPCYLIGDTWWGVPTYRYPWYDDDMPRPIGPEMGFKDMLRYRKAQGYNLIAMIAAWPNWANDGAPAKIVTEDGLTIRSAWQQSGTQSAQDMHNEGGRPFLFPGRVPGYETIYPDVERLNPDYFRYLDRKIDYLNSQGFVAFIEVSRRDASEAWKRHYPWPDSYTRYVQYVFSRYQANACILSPIHFDWGDNAIPSREFNAAANAVVAKGVPAFGSLCSCNSSGSSYNNFGGADEAPWLTLHQIGNRRHHNSHWLLTDIYNEVRPPRPALNGEPYYPGFPPGNPVPPDSAEADLYARSGMYGSLLSGGLAGHIYGCEGLWPGKIEPEAPYKQWEALTWRSGAQMTLLRDFVLSEGTRYRELVPNADWVFPNHTGPASGNRGWAYCARTPDKSLFMVYLEADCPQATVRGALFRRQYAAQWYDRRTGAWLDAGLLTANVDCELALPPQPDASEDWAVKLKLV
jgi:hypothetical protein